jgi:hypothetical protein
MKVDRDGLWLWKSFTNKKEEVVRVVKNAAGVFIVKSGPFQLQINQIKLYYQSGNFLLFIHHNPSISADEFIKTELYSRLNKPILR